MTRKSLCLPAGNKFRRPNQTTAVKGGAKVQFLFLFFLLPSAEAGCHGAAACAKSWPGKAILEHWDSGTETSRARCPPAPAVNPETKGKTVNGKIVGELILCLCAKPGIVMKNVQPEHENMEAANAKMKHTSTLFIICHQHL